MAVVVWSLALTALVLQVARLAEATCVWYGVCGTSPDKGLSVPCAYSGPAKPLTDPVALRQLSQLCPTLTQGQPVDTCCDAKQVGTLWKEMAVPEQVFGDCPSCMVNLVNIFCQMTCSANQSAFLHVDEVIPDRQVMAVTYAMSRSFAKGMFQSCKGVTLPSSNQKALGLMCGRPVEGCTEQDLFDSLGGRSSIPLYIQFNLTDHPILLPDGTRLTPMSAPWWRCSQSPGQGRPPCSCQDCPEERCSAPLPLLPALPCSATFRQPAKGDNLIGKIRKRNQTSSYIDQYVIVHRKGHYPDIEHDYPPPSTKTVAFSPVFDLHFLHQVLEIQETLQALKGASQRGDVTYRDVCRRDAKGDCACSSPLDYFQGNGTNLDKVVKDTFGFYVLADYMDHFLSCFATPDAPDDVTALHMPCLSSTGQVTQPFHVFCGFTYSDFRLASGLVLNLPIKNPDVSYAASVWRDKLRDFVESVQHQNMTLTYFQP